MRRPITGSPKITTKFGVKDSYAKFGRHSGIDYSLPTGTPIYAPTSGKLTNVISKTGGNMVVIQDGKYIHRLMHNSKFLVKSGSKVKEGDKIALSGNTGLSTGPHLHHDVNTQGTYPTSFDAFIDPDKLLKLIEEEKMITNREDAIWIWRTVKQKHSPNEKEKREYTGKNLTKLLQDLSNDADVVDFKHVYRVDYPAALRRIKSLEAELAKAKIPVPADPDSITVTKTGLWQAFVNLFKKG